MSVFDTSSNLNVKAFPAIHPDISCLNDLNVRNNNKRHTFSIQPISSGRMKPSFSVSHVRFSFHRTSRLNHPTSKGKQNPRESNCERNRLSIRPFVLKRIKPRRQSINISMEVSDNENFQDNHR